MAELKPRSAWPARHRVGFHGPSRGRIEAEECRTGLDHGFRPSCYIHGPSRGRIEAPSSAFSAALLLDVHPRLTTVAELKLGRWTRSRFSPRLTNCPVGLPVAGLRGIHGSRRGRIEAGTCRLKPHQSASHGCSTAHDRGRIEAPGPGGAVRRRHRSSTAHDRGRIEAVPASSRVLQGRRVVIHGSRPWPN